MVLLQTVFHVIPHFRRFALLIHCRGHLLTHAPLHHAFSIVKIVLMAYTLHRFEEKTDFPKHRHSYALYQVVDEPGYLKFSRSSSSRGIEDHSDERRRQYSSTDDTRGRLLLSQTSTA